MESQFSDVFSVELTGAWRNIYLEHCFQGATVESSPKEYEFNKRLYNSLKGRAVSGDVSQVDWKHTARHMFQEIEKDYEIGPDYYDRFSLDVVFRVIDEVNVFSNPGWINGVSVYIVTGSLNTVKMSVKEKEYCQNIFHGVQDEEGEVLSFDVLYMDYDKTSGKDLEQVYRDVPGRMRARVMDDKGVREKSSLGLFGWLARIFRPATVS